MSDHGVILEWHPEMVFVSGNPMTWRGFLIASCQSDIGQSVRVKLKLVAPYYPSLEEMQLRFGSRPNALRDKRFHQKVDELMKAATTVPSFLRQLQSLAGNFLSEANKSLPSLTEKRVKDMLLELKDTLGTPSEVSLSSTNDLNAIKLSLRNISLVLRKQDGIDEAWKVVSSDLPEIPAFGPFEKNLTTLRMARNKFELQVGIFEKSWCRLREIDENCCIIDPVPAKPYHLYRRIYLTDSLSMLININPLIPEDLPDIKFLGSETEVERQRNVVSNNLHNWNREGNILENLLTLLNLQQFPKKIKTEDVDMENVIVTDEECCICFFLELGDLTYPDKVCSNIKCRKQFHTPCLLTWLQAVPGNEVAFNYIHGKCPNCEENICCRVN